MNQSLLCFTCDVNSQGIQESQMKEFIALGVLKVNVNNWIVLVDNRSSLPYAGTGGIAPLVQEIANWQMALHVELQCELEPASCKFNDLGNIDFESYYIE